jgi:hypothetical protein
MKMTRTIKPSTDPRHPFDTYDTDGDARPTAAAIVVLCVLAGVALACGLMVWGLL